MTLREYIEEFGLQVTWVAKQLGLCRTTLYKIEKSGKISHWAANRIYKFTDGKVDYRDKVKK
jgi:DNA-binding XRE family transcriptional regulator